MEQNIICDDFIGQHNVSIMFRTYFIYLNFPISLENRLVWAFSRFLDRKDKNVADCPKYYQQNENNR